MTTRDMMARVPALASALALAGCVTTSEVPEIPPLPDRAPDGFQESLEAQIAETLPRVSYAPDSPDYLGPLVQASRAEGETLDREMIQGWIRRLESLDGEGTVVCRGTTDDVFGDCSFPRATEPSSRAPSSD